MQCRHIREDGTRCGVTFGLVEGLCWHHDPGRAKDADAARRKGLKAASQTSRRRRGGTVKTVDPTDAPGGPPQTAEEARQWVAWATWAVATGQIDARTAREVGYNVRAFLTAHEKTEMEAAIEELRAHSKKIREDRGGDVE